MDITKPDSIGYIPERWLVLNRYKHFKGGIYLITGFSFNAGTDLWEICYKEDSYMRKAYRRFSEFKDMTMLSDLVPFTRTHANFFGTVNGQPRFEYMRGVTVYELMYS